MNRNTESHFALTPTANIGRSKFDRSFDLKTTFSTGLLIPTYCSEVLPGDTVKMRMSHVVRMMTPIAPVMDNAYLDTYFFYVPNRIIWDNFKRFMGENDTAPWTQTGDYAVPQIVAPENGWKKGSLADYFGYKTNVGGYKASALPFRAYVKIWNDWFRDQNLKNPCYMQTGDADITGTDKTTLGASYDYVVDTEKGAAPIRVAKFHDYFTSALPDPQKGPSVGLPLGAKAPVIGIQGTIDTSLFDSRFEGQRIQNKGNGSNINVTAWDGSQQLTLSQDKYIELGVDLSEAVGTTINQLRQAYAIQKFYENDAINGTRYIELVKGHFNVTNPDFRVQRSEYLGGKRIPINMNSLYATEQTTEGLVPTYGETPAPSNLVWERQNGLPQGTPGAYSVTTDTDEDLFTHSFTEHGWLIGLVVVRTDHTYQQGMNAQFFRKDKFDFYWPEFAHLGNMPIYNREIYMDGTDDDNEAFGYQEAYASYRYHPNMVTGAMRSDYNESLDIWHYADNYETRPTLSSEWIDEPAENMKRTLAVQDEDDFFGDFYFGTIWTRPMPLYSIPGLTGHY